MPGWLQLSSAQPKAWWPRGAGLCVPASARVWHSSFLGFSLAGRGPGWRIPPQSYANLPRFGIAFLLSTCGLRSGRMFKRKPLGLQDLRRSAKPWVCTPWLLKPLYLAPPPLFLKALAEVWWLACASHTPGARSLA